MPMIYLTCRRLQEISRSPLPPLAPNEGMSCCKSGHVSKGLSMSLSLYAMPTICDHLIGQPISACVNQFSHLLGLELADSSSTELSMLVDMLTGSKYYW